MCGVSNPATSGPERVATHPTSYARTYNWPASAHPSPSQPRLSGDGCVSPARTRSRSRWDRAPTWTPVPRRAGRRPGAGDRPACRGHVAWARGGWASVSRSWGSRGRAARASAAHPARALLLGCGDVQTGGLTGDAVLARSRPPRRIGTGQKPPYDTKAHWARLASCGACRSPSGPSEGRLS